MLESHNVMLLFILCHHSTQEIKNVCVQVQFWAEHKVSKSNLHLHSKMSLNKFRLLICIGYILCLFLNNFFISQMYMLINFTAVVQAFYKGFRCRLMVVLSAFINKEFCMQKSKVKTFIYFSFSSVFEKWVDWTSIMVITFLFEPHLKPNPKGVCTHWHIKR